MDDKQFLEAVEIDVRTFDFRVDRILDLYEQLLVFSSGLEDLRRDTQIYFQLNADKIVKNPVKLKQISKMTKRAVLQLFLESL